MPDRSERALQTRRQMHLIAYSKTGPTARHVGGWRHPESTLDDFLKPSRYAQYARTLEDAKFDGCFFADLIGVYDIYGGSYETYIRNGGQISYLDPMTVLPIMAEATRNLGLGITLSTTFHNPYHLARWLSSIDVLSGGRAAWNIVTSAAELEAKNVGGVLPPKEERYDRADEVLEACCALWNSWDEDAFVLDKERGVFADPEKVHYVDYEGRWVRTRGPLPTPRSPQGRPVLMQAGSSDRGRDFAARWAEAIFTDQPSLGALKAFYDDIKGRMAGLGRRPQDCAVLNAATFVIGETESIARERAEYLKSLINPETWAARVSGSLGADVRQVEDEKALAYLQGTQGIQGATDRILTTIKEKGVSFREAAKAESNNEIVGTPAQIADQLQHVFESGACDGFIVAPTYFPGMIEQFCRSVVPELQRRGIFRREYTGRTLRENLLAA
ncbi:MAG: LLM class flavin-dependent oxidoreductase [Azospirillum brasilense]|nr:MAG: LLM class flavin-dependent oxidoreductase [Azospirillum brasilense]